MDNQDAVEVTCTDNGKKVTGYILNYRVKDQLEISLNTVKIRMQYKSGIFVGLWQEWNLWWKKRLYHDNLRTFIGRFKLTLLRIMYIM